MGVYLTPPPPPHRTVVTRGRLAQHRTMDAIKKKM